MRRTTVSLPDDLALALEREARRRDVSASQIAREALEQHLLDGGEGPRELPFAALGGSGHRTTGRDLDVLLDEEWRDLDRDR